MKTLSAIPLISLVMFAAACHSARSPGAAVASNIVAVSSLCRATVDGTDVSTWREVAATDFTFCVPADWRVGERDARHGSATLKWGPGAPPRETLGRSTGPVPGPTVSKSSLDLRNFSEEIGGQLAQLFRNRYGDDKYSSGARWETPAIWFSGQSRTAREIDVQIAIYRTVRFTPASTARGQTSSPGPIQLRVPPTIGRLTMQRRHDYEDPSEGVQLRYVGADSLPIDVFVYPGPDLANECSLECASKVMHDEIAIFQSAFPEMIHRHYVDSISVVRNDSLAAGSGAPWALARHLTLAVVRNGAPQRSDFVLYYLPGYRIKIRATYIATAANVDVVKAFLEAAVPALTSTADSAAPL